MRPQLQFLSRDGKTCYLGQVHQLRQVFRRAALGLQGRVSSHRLQELAEGRALYGLALVAGCWLLVAGCWLLAHFLPITRCKYQITRKSPLFAVSHHSYAKDA